MRRIAIIGSTGSIGQSTLSVAGHLSDRLRVFALAASSSIDRLVSQTAAVHPEVVAIADSGRVDEYQRKCRNLGISVPSVVTGSGGLRQVASASEVDVVVSGIVGAAGLWPTYCAVLSGKIVALANKESMVLAGELLKKTAKASGACIIPVDSEHCAVDQCLRAGRHSEVRRLILTASGGPFRERPVHQFSAITPEEALKHPTWQMGRRITIDSATLMNKGLEVIEARWLFDMPAAKVDIMVHPQSIVHSMVEFVDGSTVAQLGTADMRQPIQYALTYPERLPSQALGLDWSSISRLDFSPPDLKKFPCVSLAYSAIELGGTAPAVLNAADEVAVGAFLDRRISFTDIPRLIEATLQAHDQQQADSVDSIMAADAWAREYARNVMTETVL